MMEVREQEKNLDTICDRIGETVYQIQELTEEKNKVEGYLMDMEQIGKIPEHDKTYLYSILSALFEADPNYQKQQDILSHLSYGILKQHEKEIESDLAEWQRLEEEQMKINGEVGKLKQEQERIEEQEIFCMEQQKTFIPSVVSLIVMVGISSGLCYWAWLFYEFSYEIPLIFIGLIGIFCLILLLFSRQKRKHRLAILQKRKMRLQQYYENLMNRFEQSLFLKTEMEERYFVKNKKELFDGYQLYIEEKKLVQPERLKEVRKVFVHTLSAYGIQYPELFLNYPHSLVEYSERKQVKNYFEARKRQNEKHFLWQERLQDSYFAKIQEIVTQYPDLREEANRALKTYGISISEQLELI